MHTISRIQSALTCFALLAAMSLATGCKAPWRDDWRPSDMYSLESTWPWRDDEDEPQTPERLVGSWTDTVLHQGGKKPQRGFGGRLIFYGKDSSEPVLVEGQLVVYAFDETNREPTDNKPSRRYVFPPDQVVRHMSKSAVGPSYSFWLPWDEEGGPQTEVSLVARFEPKEGSVVVGEQTRHLLPGKLTSEMLAASGQPTSTLPEGIPSRPAMPQLPQAKEIEPAPNFEVQQASYEGPAAAPQAQRRMTTTSISLPENFRRRSGSTTAPAASSGAPTAVTPNNPAAATPAQPAAAATAKFSQNAPAAFQRQPLQAGFKPMPQSPFAGQAMYGVPPQTQPSPTQGLTQQGVTPQGLTQQLPMQARQQMPPQMLGPQVPASANESQWTTTVSYAPVEGVAGQTGQPIQAGQVR